VLRYTHIVCLVDFAIGRDSVVGLATDYGLEVRGSNSGGAEISSPVETGRGASPSYCTMGTWSLSRGV